MSLYRLKRVLLSLIYPNRCPFCTEVIRADAYYHDACARELELYTDADMDTDSTFFCVYNEKSTPLLTKAKENADGYAISAIAWFLFNTLEYKGFMQSIDIIAPVPARKSAMRSRGYSFPALLAKELAGLSGKQCRQGLLKFLREPGEQKGLTAAERAANVQGAFKAKSKHGQSRNVLIVDDVSTTGATLLEARRALLEAGAGQVYVAAFTKTI